MGIVELLDDIELEVGGAETEDVDDEADDEEVEVEDVVTEVVDLPCVAKIATPTIRITITTITATTIDVEIPS